MSFNQNFRWDAEKAISNLRKHGISFEQASAVFLDPLSLTVFDAAHSEIEDRWFTLGRAGEGKLLAVAHTFRVADNGETLVRIISARPATKREQFQYAGKFS